MLLKGVDVFFTDPGTKDEVFCQICHSKCEVKRNVYGSTSSAMAMGKKKVLHDVFTCPNAGQVWHDRAGKLVTEINNTASKRVAELLKQDLDDLLTNNLN